MNDGFQKYSEEKHKRKMKEMEKSCVRSASIDTLDVCGKGNIGKYLGNESSNIRANLARLLKDSAILCNHLTRIHKTI